MFARSAQVVRTAVAVAMFALTGCQAATYVCSDDSQCAGPAGGRCDDGFCSFPDARCESGQAYSAHSGPKSGQCVPADAEETGTGEGPAGTTSTTAETTETRPSSTDTSAAVTNGSTSAPTTSVDASTAGDSTSDTGTPASSSDASTTGDPQPFCDGRLLIQEEFDDDPSDVVWQSWGTPGASGATDAGVWRVSVDVPAAGASSAYTGKFTTMLAPSSGTCGLEIVEASVAAQTGNLFFEVNDGAWSFAVQVVNGELESLWSDQANVQTPLSAYEYDPIEHRWVRFVYDANTLEIAVDVSPDGTSWSTLDIFDASRLDFDGLRVQFGAGAYAGPLADESFVRLDNVFVCAP